MKMFQVTLTEEQLQILIARTKIALESAKKEWKPRVPFEETLLETLECAVIGEGREGLRGGRDE